jgi:hypothetical protein
MPDKTREVVPQPQSEQQSGCLSTIARVFWIMVGNFALLVFLVLILQKGRFSWLDIAFWGTTGLVLLVRYFDVRCWSGLTPDGERATLRDWRKHAVVLLPIAGGLWAVVRILQLLHR